MSGNIAPLSYFSQRDDESWFCPSESFVVIFIISDHSLFILLAHGLCPATSIYGWFSTLGCFRLCRWASKLPVQLQLDFEPILLRSRAGHCHSHSIPCWLWLLSRQASPSPVEQIFPPASFWRSCQGVCVLGGRWVVQCGVASSASLMFSPHSADAWFKSKEGSGTPNSYISPASHPIF